MRYNLGEGVSDTHPEKGGKSVTASPSLRWVAASLKTCVTCMRSRDWKGNLSVAFLDAKSA